MHSIEDEICAGGWKCLCAGVMLQAVESLRQERLKGPRAMLPGGYKEDARQRAIARDWVAGGTGAITFEDCCDSLGVNPERARAKLMAHIRGPYQR